MYCPKCGQEQAAEVTNFCSRCGFQLTEVTGLLARGGAPAEIQGETPPRPKRRRTGLWLLLASFVFFVLALMSAATEGDASIALFGLLTVASFFVGWCVLIATWVRGRRRRSETVPVGQNTIRMDAPQQGALPPAYAPPVSVPRTPFDTGEVAQPPSVTESTTRHLEHEEPPRQSARTR